MNTLLLTIKIFRPVQKTQLYKIKLKIKVINMHNSCYILMSLDFWACLCMNMFMTQMDHRMLNFSKFGNAGAILSHSKLKLGLSKIPDLNTGNESPWNAHRIGPRWRPGLPSVWARQCRRLYPSQWQNESNRTIQSMLWLIMKPKAPVVSPLCLIRGWSLQ